MHLRGQDMMGTRQSGQLQFKLASLTQDGGILQWTRGVVEQILTEDSQLNDINHVAIKEHWKSLYKEGWGWNRIS